MNIADADAILYLVDKLRERGASLIEVEGVKAGFPSATPPLTERKPKPRKTYHERLMGHLPKRDPKRDQA